MMKIVHICLCDAYSDNWSYHRNILSEQNAAEGNITYVIALPYVMDNDGNSGEKRVGTYINAHGVNVIRLNNRYRIPKKVQGKLRSVKGLYQALKEIKPDIIMVHNIQSLSIVDVIKYKNEHQEVLLLGDSHASFENSCRNAISRYIIQGLIFRHLIKKYYYSFDVFYFIGIAERDFFETVYRLPLKQCNILPLPARFIEEEKKIANRKRIRAELGIEDDDIPLFVHSGKMVKEKKTDAIIKALENCIGNYHLVIIGSIPKGRESLLEKINNSENISYLGWLSSDTLSMYISAADLYLQPGTPSVTMNNALAAGTPVMVQPNPTYQLFYNGWEFVVRDENEIKDVLQAVIDNPEIARSKISSAYSTARKYFDCSCFTNEMYLLSKSRSYRDSFIYENNSLRVIHR